MPMRSCLKPKRRKSGEYFFIMEKYSISWEAYHELSQQDQTLPRSYLVQGCQDTRDSSWDIRKAPRDQPGAELPLEDLLKRQLEEYVSETS